MNIKGMNIKDMNIKEKIALIRGILNNAETMNMKPEIILEISKKIDEYINEYYRERKEA